MEYAYIVIALILIVLAGYLFSLGNIRDDMTDEERKNANTYRWFAYIISAGTILWIIYLSLTEEPEVKRVKGYMCGDDKCGI